MGSRASADRLKLFISKGIAFAGRDSGFLSFVQNPPVLPDQKEEHGSFTGSVSGALKY